MQKIYKKEIKIKSNWSRRFDEKLYVCVQEREGENFMYVYIWLMNINLEQQLYNNKIR